MLPNDDLARLGEPPTNDAEMVLADQLADYLDGLRRDAEAPSVANASGSSEVPTVANASGSSGAPAQTRSAVTGMSQHLLETSDWIEDMVHSVLTHSGVLDSPQQTGPTGGKTIDLRLRVLRVVGPLNYQPVASTHAQPTVLRDMRRVPDNPDRVSLRTGDRVRVEVLCDHDGYLTVFNVGPTETVNVLYPEPQATVTPLRARTPLLIADVQMTPPAGKERLFVVWSRSPLAGTQITGLIQPEVALRDMRRVQDRLEELRPEDWHAVMLELEHIA